MGLVGPMAYLWYVLTIIFLGLSEGAADPECRSKTPANFCVFLSDPEPESKIFEKPEPELVSLFIVCSRSILGGLYKCHFSRKNIAKFWLHRWQPESEQESDSQIWKICRIRIHKFWSRSAVRVWKCDSGHLWDLPRAMESCEDVAWIHSPLCLTFSRKRCCVNLQVPLFLTFLHFS